MSILCSLTVFYLTSVTLGSIPVLTPFGYWPKECVHGVLSGSIIENKDDHLLIKHKNSDLNNYKINRCNKFNIQEYQQRYTVDGDGWQVYTKIQSGDTTSGLLGQWPVPSSPSEGGGTIFTFTALQNIDWVPPEKDPDQAFDIIQPVLQHGGSAAGGGNYWTIASWYVTLGLDVLYSELRRVDVGDIIFGSMTRLNITGLNETGWYINALDTNSNTKSDLFVVRSILETQPWSYITLEVYDVFGCGQYPPKGTTIPYTKIKLYENEQEVPADWVVGTDGQSPPICDASISIGSGGDVTITF